MRYPPDRTLERGNADAVVISVAAAKRTLREC